MDGQRFDTLAKRVATTSRRQLLRGLAAAAVAGLWPARTRASSHCGPPPPEGEYIECGVGCCNANPFHAAYAPICCNDGIGASCCHEGHGCCGRVCQPPGYVCCEANNTCGPVGDAYCCPVDPTVYGSDSSKSFDCCATQAATDRYGIPRQYCHGDGRHGCIEGCPPEGQCGRFCCPPNFTCDPDGTTVETACRCPEERTCDGGATCCLEGELCVGVAPARCCPAGKACGLYCCDEDQTCCDGVQCCSPGRVCADGVCVCPSGEQCGGACCPPGRSCDATTETCACPPGHEECGDICCPEGQPCEDPDAGRCGGCPPDEQACGVDFCCPSGTFCCDPGQNLCCPADAECCSPDSADAVCCAAPNGCAKEGFPTPPDARTVCCPPERHGGGDEIAPEFCCPAGQVAASVFTPNGLCCEPDSLCNGVCCSPPGGAFPAVCCGGQCCGPAPESQCCAGSCKNAAGDPQNCGGCGVTCRADQECAAGQCRCPGGAADCAGVCCPASEACQNGRCRKSRDCTGVTCPAGEVCQNGRCRKSRDCAGVTCPSGEECRNGRCRRVR